MVFSALSESSQRFCKPQVVGSNPTGGLFFDVLQNDPDDVEALCPLPEVMRARDPADAARTHFERTFVIDVPGEYAPPTSGGAAFAPPDGTLAGNATP